MRENITGLRSGHLTAIEPTDQKRRGCTLWRCQCDCGKESFQEAYKIVNGKVKSCGCSRKGHGMKELTDQRFGRLVAVERLSRKKGSNYLWLCRYDCGQEIHAAANKLKYGCYTSCGCMKAYRLHDSNGYVDNTCLKMVFSEAVRPDNTSGVRGVYRKRGRWAASIQYKKRSYYLGSYINKDDAIRARHEAEARIKEDAAQLLQLL